MNQTSNLNNTNTDAITLQFFSYHLICISHITYSLIFGVGMIANIIVGVSQMLRRWTSVGVYTFNLVVCDILILLLYIPTQMVLMEDQLAWNMGTSMCTIVNIILPITLCCTVGTLLAVAFDRLHAILRPFQWRMNSTRRAMLIVPIIWSISVLTNIPLASHAQVKEFNSIPCCDEGWETTEEGETFWSCLFVFTYAVPLLVLALTHAHMISIIRNNCMAKYHTQNTKVIRMGIYLVSVFVVCTGFQHIYFFINASFSKIHLNMDQMAYLYVISNYLVSAQACINPFLYGSLCRTLMHIIESNKTTKKIYKRFVYRRDALTISALKEEDLGRLQDVRQNLSIRRGTSETIVNMAEFDDHKSEKVESLVDSEDSI